MDKCKCAHCAHAVTYVEDGNHYALVIAGNADSNDSLNLYVIKESGEPEVKNGVPHRGPNSPDGNNRTWH